MPTLPVGTLTLLFTDIEGSTRLLKELAGEYERLLSDHRRLLRSRFEENGGVVVDTQGDAFFVVFRRAYDAVVAAVGAQHELAAHDWPASAQPRVRMAIHTGEPARVDDGLAGLSVHRAARMCAAGHGGQVLLSATARDLVEDHLPPGVALLDLGPHQLKDLDRPEHIAQLLIEGVPPVFTPLKSLTAQPESATPFEGQEERLASAAQAAMARVQPESATATARWRAAARARALEWRRFVRLPGGSRFANRVEGIGFSIHATTRIAPRDDLAAELRSLGRALVTAARDARSADTLLRAEQGKALTRRLAEYRRSAYSEYTVRRADSVARQIAALGALAKTRRQFELEARALEQKVRAIRPRVFDSRLDSQTLDALVLEIRPLRESAEQLSTTLHEALEPALRGSGDAARRSGH
jgi:class 3 adenylate cyclase